MPLPKPILDDRSYQQLRDELVRRIPVYNREWTDHNPSDPGVTLIELFAFLGENLLFRFNQIPEATRLAFLRLLHVPLRPAQAARAMIAAEAKDPSGVLAPLGSPASAGSIPFETTTELLAWPVSAVAVSKAGGVEDPEDGTEEGDFAHAAKDAAGVDPDKGERPAYYRPAVVPQEPSRPGSQPVDFGMAVDQTMWVAVVGQPGVTDLAELEGKTLNLGLIVDEDVTSLDEITDPCPGEGAQSAASPDTVWEYSTGELDPDGQPIYRRLDLEGDTTRGLTQTGVVRLSLPKDSTKLKVFPATDPALVGTRGFPPELEDQDLQERTLFWVRAYRRIASDRPLPRAVWVGANAAEVVQTRKARPQFLGTGNGQPDQELKLAHRPVMAGSLIVEVEEPGGFKPWKAVDGFQASSESDRHYVVDLEAGTVHFGNGVKGMAPQLGQRIRALEYRYGGGPEGNVPAKALNKLDEQPVLKVQNPMPARGGAPAEAVDEALERVPSELRRRDRAVTSSDFRELALQTPGAGLGRAEALALFHPPSRSTRAAGVMSVVVWPAEDRKHPSAPVPDRTQLRQVCAWLDARRLVTTELWVIPPTYRKVAVAIGLKIKAGFGIEAVRRWVELVVRQYLAPLPPYGPEGQGWPLGRKVIARELEAAVLQVEGVRFLADDVKLAELDASGQWVSRDEVELQPWEVPELSEITVVEDAPLQPGQVLQPPALPDVPVPIPTLKEEC